MDASSSDVLGDAREEAYFMVGYTLEAQLHGDPYPHYLILPDGRRVEVEVEVALLNRSAPRFVVRRHDRRRPVLDDGVPRPAPDGYVLASATTQERRLFGGGPWPPRETAWGFRSKRAEWDLWVLPAAVVATRPKRKIRGAELGELVGPPVRYTQLADTVNRLVPPRRADSAR
jgi:hypothetical protein